MHKIKTHHQHHQGKIFAWMVLIMGLGMSLIFPIFPNFVKEIVKSDSAVSLFYAAMAIMMLVAALASTILLKKVERREITKWGFLIGGISFFLLIFASQLTELTILRTLQTWVKLFLLMTLSLFVRDFADAKNLGEEEGTFYKFHNIGLLLGPLMGGVLAAYFGYEIVFVIAAAVLFGGLGYFYHQNVIQEHPAIINLRKTTKHKLITNIKDFFSDIQRIKAYMITLTLMLWIGFRHLYIPLFVLERGFSEGMSGFILAAGVVPFILLEVKVGEYADRKGVKIPISAGFLIIAISLFVIFISPSLWLSFLMLVVANIGAALVEPIQEYFLFKNLSKEDEDRLYGVYMTADPVAYFLAPAIGAIILLFLPFNYLFLIFGGFMLLTSLLSWSKLKHQ